MSRIGKSPIDIPNGVEINISNNCINVSGPKGRLEFIYRKSISVKVEKDNTIIISRKNEDKSSRSLHGTTRAIINNMIIGITKGFEKELNLVGVGYKASINGEKLIVNAGYSHPIEIHIDKELDIEVPKPTVIIVRGIDKQKVGAYAANIRNIRKPEPYKGKGIKYAAEYIKRKVGKTGSK